MKKLLLLIALSAALCFFGTKAEAELGEQQQASEEWFTCAIPILNEQALEAEVNPTQFIKNVCDFYQMPVPECSQYFSELSPEDQEDMIKQYVFRRHIFPSCGLN